MLGCRILQAHYSGDVSLDQEQYIQDLLEKFNMADCSPRDSPAHSTPLRKYQADRDKLTKHFHEYQSLVGALIWLVVASRPDLAQAVSELSKHMATPTEEHWRAAKLVLRYLQKTKGKKLIYRRRQRNEPGYPLLEAFSDASYGTCPDTSRSRYGYLFRLAGGPISWISRLQTIVAQSTMEAEYVALSMASRHLMWMRYWLGEVKMLQEGPTIMYGDNQASIRLASTGMRTSKSKHIMNKYHYVQRRVHDGHIKLVWLHTGEMLADIFTKPLQGGAQIKLLNWIFEGKQVHPIAI